MSKRWVCLYACSIMETLSESRELTAEAENRPKSAHRYNVAEQQQIYKSEIERIWKAQFDSLSRKEEPQLTAEDEERAEVKKPQQHSSNRRESYPPYVPAMSPPGNPGASSPAFSRGSSLERDRDESMGPESGTRVLRIKRFVRFGFQLEPRNIALDTLTCHIRLTTNGKSRSSVIPLLYVPMSEAGN